MSDSTPEKNLILNERLKEHFRAFRTVILTVLLLGVSVPVMLAVVHERQEDAHQASLASLLIELDRSDGAAGLAGIVRNSGIRQIRIADTAGIVLDSSEPGEVGEALDSRLLSRIAGVNSGIFSFEMDSGAQAVTVTGLKDASAGRVVVLSQPRRSFIIDVLPPLAAGLILSLALCSLIVLRAWSLSSRFHESAGKLETALRDALQGSTGVAPGRVRDAVAGDVLESIGMMMGDVLSRTHSAEHRAAAAADTTDAVFNALPHPAYVRTPDGRIAAVNQSLCDELDRPAADLVSASESEIQRTMPIDRVRMLLGRQGFRNRGIKGLIVYPASNRLTIMPVTLNGDEAHLVMLEMNEKTVHSVERDSPETPRGLRMAIEIAETERPLQARSEPLNLIASNEINSGLADLYGATDLAVWAIDENGRTLHWSRAARRLTGVWKREIPDLEAFCRLILTDEVQRQTLIRWLDSDPTRLSRQLVCRTEDGVPVGLTWNADETLVRTRPGEMKRVTVLWCKAPVEEDAGYRV